MGCILPHFGTIHTSPIPFLLGVLLLLPATLLLPVVPRSYFAIPTWLQYVVPISLNFVVWYDLYRSKAFLSKADSQ